MGTGGRKQILFHIAGAAYPAPPHGLWFLSQMRRWGWLDDGLDLSAAVSSVYRPDLYALAARMEDLFVPPGPGRNIASFEAHDLPAASVIGMSNF